MNDIGIIDWTADLAERSTDSAGTADLDAVYQCLDAAEKMLWKAADATSSMVTIDYLWRAVGELQAAQMYAAGSEFAQRVTELTDQVTRMAEIDGWAPAIGLPIGAIAQLIRDVREAA